MTEEQKTELTRLEDEIRRGDDTGIRARWASGRELLTLRAGKRLPDGVREFIANKLGVSASEVSKRMQFAGRFGTDDALCAVVTQFRSWHRIVHEALVTEKKGKTVKPSPTARLTKAATAYDPADATVDEREGEALILALRTVIHNVSYLLERKAAA